LLRNPNIGEFWPIVRWFDLITAEARSAIQPDRFLLRRDHLAEPTFGMKADFRLSGNGLFSIPFLGRKPANAQLIADLIVANRSPRRRKDALPGSAVATRIKPSIEGLL
jgi:hypothetical protein